MRALLAEGTDPIVQLKEDELEAATNEVTFETLAREWLASRQPSLTPRYARLIEMRLRACAPLLALADEVEIFMVRDGAERQDPEEAVEYLSRHGVHASVWIEDDCVRAPDAAIEEECARWRPDYVLMGAYGRGRLRETFGGVTKRMLGKAQLPIVLGH